MIRYLCLLGCMCMTPSSSEALVNQIDQHFFLRTALFDIKKIVVPFLRMELSRIKSLCFAGFCAFLLDVSRSNDMRQSMFSSKIVFMKS